MSKHTMKPRGSIGAHTAREKAGPGSLAGIHGTERNGGRGPSVCAAEPRAEQAGCLCPSHEQIARRAFELWESLGRPEGTDKELWLRSERELYEETRKASSP